MRGQQPHDVQMTTHLTKAIRTFQQQWLENLGETVEILISNPHHRYRDTLLYTLPLQIKSIHDHIYPENEGRLEAVKERLELLVAKTLPAANSGVQQTI
jgi:hypothetical protein